MWLITASVDTRIRIFDLTAAASRIAGSQKPQAVLEGHVSVPRGLDVSPDGRWLVSGGRDSMVMIWDLLSKAKNGKGKERGFSPTLTKTIPVLERVEGVGLLHSEENLVGSSRVAGGISFYTGGEKGVVKVWDGREGTVLCTFGQEVHNASNDQKEQRQIIETM
jgi:U3 small nucleolar RNA-associated protein 13